MGSLVRPLVLNATRLLGLVRNTTSKLGVMPPKPRLVPVPPNADAPAACRTKARPFPPPLVAALLRRNWKALLKVRFEVRATGRNALPAWLVCAGVSRSTVVLLMLDALPFRVSKGREKLVTVNPGASDPFIMAKAKVKAVMILVVAFIMILGS